MKRALLFLNYLMFFLTFISCRIDCEDSADSNNSDDFVAVEIPAQSGEEIYFVNFNRSATEKISSEEMSLPVFTEGIFSVQTDGSRSAAETSESDYKNFICGTTKKKIFTDEFSILTLQAKKESGETACLLWAEEQKNLSDQFLQSTAEVSHKIYAEETSDFGADKSIEGSETFNALNVVLYDIEENSVAGFFNRNDFLQKSKNPESNFGKYIYLDISLCSDSKILSSTLAHEIMHLKTFSNFIQTDSWFSELLSMLAEDFYADGPDSLARLNGFYKNHHLLGIDQWRNLDPVSYAKTYAFGSWISDFFGGKEFVQKVFETGRTDGLSNMEALLSAAEKVSGKKYSQQEIFELFIKDCVTQIKNKNYSAFNSLQSAQLQSHGFMIHYAGTAEGKSAVLYFRKKKNTNEEIIIFSGDKTYVF